MSNAVIVSIHYKDRHSHRMKIRFVDALRVMSKICKRELTCDIRRTGISLKPSTRARPKITRWREWHWRDSRETCTSWCEFFAQRKCYWIIIITSWRLRVQVSTLGKSTTDESNHYIVVRRMSNWNSSQGQDTTNCRSETSIHLKRSKKSRFGWNHGLAPNQQESLLSVHETVGSWSPQML